jgi:biotin carboxylase
VQVEHTVTEVVTGVDIVKAQIRLAQGARIGTPESGVPARRTSASTGTPCSAGSPPRIPRTSSSRTTGASPPTARRRASGSASTGARPTPGRSSRPSTTPCSRRSRPGRRRRPRPWRAWTGRCASSGSGG